MACGDSRVHGLEGTGLAPPYLPPLDPSGLEVSR
jgi:hypothetical protein